MANNAALADLITTHLARYPLMTVQDAYKLLYQGALGPEHLITDAATFTAHLRVEMSALVEAATEPLWESLRPDATLGRLHLRPYHARGGELEALIAACLATAAQPWESAMELRSVWHAFDMLCHIYQWAAFPVPEVAAFTQWLAARDYPAVHHSPAYRAAYHPAYRLVSQRELQTLAAGLHS